MKMEIQEIKNRIENATVAVASVGLGDKPHAIAVMYAKVKDGKIVITNNYMSSTIENLKRNPYVSLVFWEGDEGWGIDGKVEYFDSGEWLDFVRELKENEGFEPKGALVVCVERIRELG